MHFCAHRFFCRYKVEICNASLHTPGDRIAQNLERLLTSICTNIRKKRQHSPIGCESACQGSSFSQNIKLYINNNMISRCAQCYSGSSCEGLTPFVLQEIDPTSNNFTQYSIEKKLCDTSHYRKRNRKKKTYQISDNISENPCRHTSNKQKYIKTCALNVL